MAGLLLYRGKEKVSRFREFYDKHLTIEPEKFCAIALVALMIVFVVNWIIG